MDDEISLDLNGKLALRLRLVRSAVVAARTGWSDRRGTRQWTADTGAMVFSATKGMASTVIHRLADNAAERASLESRLSELRTD